MLHNHRVQGRREFRESDVMLKRTDTDAVAAFIKVAERMSFRAAAADLGVSPSAVSQMVKALETNLGTALLSRTTRSVGLTEAGMIFLEQARPALENLEACFTTLRIYSGRPSGTLRLNASRGVIPFLLDPLREFCEAYPGIEVELFAEDGLSDIAANGFDAGIRLGERIQPDMVAVRLSPSFRFIVAGSPSYFAQNPKPEHPNDLGDHRCIRFRLGTSGKIINWTFRDGKRTYEVAVKGPMILNDTPAMVAAALKGLGLIYVAEPVIEEHLSSGRLVSVVDDCAIESPGLFLYYPKRNSLLPKLRVFVEFARARGRQRESFVSRAT
ncbi:DNA-binding transcriptional LysR family regulator [Rhizobium azibense]|uniref:HTH-type transcriptional regulator TtuA n=1 Tax=Rhizobium azibense TaxID=1136135 RepID=A0A4R3Q6R6_9HYPH|nr:DNA-binding transcriptional LysR family regulator [Rhizobium azibense]